MKTAAVVILYHPDRRAMENIARHRPLVDEWITWDNTQHNVGIGRALNEAIAVARRRGCTHLLTLDQDSRFADGELTRYLQAIAARDDRESAIFSTNYYLASQQNSYYPVTHSVERVATAMTSGSVYPLALFDALGLFRGELFVWGIDMEFSWRAARQGIPTLCFRDVLLEHNLGYQRRKHRLLGREVFPNEYPSDRTYYNVRNGILLHRLYPAELPLCPHLRYHLYKRIVFVLLYEKQKAAKLRALYQGWRDGRSGVWGKRKK
ncbi:MAG: glycosyl transferase family 2 [Prevotellaceae bacterium]|jgi:rhamnosyltransferase|nr:glycosyl transferase family 2 [Prevotellaceae bacterium]